MSRITNRKDVVTPQLVQAWQADAPSPAELRAGYARFLREPPRRRRLPAVGRWLAVGMVFGIGLAQAGTFVAQRLRQAHPLALMVSTQHAGHAASAHAARTSARPTPQADVMAEPAPQTDVKPPPELEPVATPDRTDARPAPGRAQPSVPSTDPATPYVQQQWQQAAAAIREHDFAKADAALRRLELTADGSEREAAQLARAQLLLSNGRASEALTLARALERNASSSMMRDKARELASRLTKKDAGPRSTGPDAAFNQP